MMPSVIESWKVAISLPRSCTGAISDWYSGTTTEMAPTAVPETKRIT